MINGYCLTEGLASYGLWASKLPAFINNVSLECSYAHLFICCLYFLLSYKSRGEQLQQKLYDLQSLK